MFGEEKIGWQLAGAQDGPQKTATIPMIVCSGAVNELKEMEGHLMAKGIGVLYKPFDVDELLDLVASKLMTEESGNNNIEHAPTETTNRPQRGLTTHMICGGRPPARRDPGGE